MTAQSDFPNILVSSNNPDKLAEMQAILGDAPLTLIAPSAIPTFPQEIEEDGLTLEENAYIKASAVFEATGLPVVADDTGLEVTVLGNRPGVFSARYAGENASYADNVHLLLQELRGKTNRSARFRTVICYKDAFRTFFAEGVCEGTISDSPSGEEGFGYDPVFVPTGYDKTFAQMSSQDKSKISHRGHALRNFVAQARAVLIHE